MSFRSLSRSLGLALAATLVGFLVGPLNAHAGFFSPFVSFDPALGELPEGVTVGDDGTVYATLFSGEVRGYAPETGAQVFTSGPVPTPLGIAVAPGGDLFVATAGGFVDPMTAAENHGVWRISPTGAASPFASLPIDSSLPNDVAVDDGGVVFASDSFGGRIYRLGDPATPEVWFEDSILLGDPALVRPPGSAPVAIGVNGISFLDDALLAVNFDFGRIVRIPVESDGSAGVSEVLFEDPRLIGIDGLAFAPDGTLFVTNSFTGEVLIVREDGSIEVFADGLESPANLAFGVGDQSDQLFVANFALANVTLGVSANPGIVSATVPEPSTAALLALGLAALGGRSFRRAAMWVSKD